MTERLSNDGTVASYRLSDDEPVSLGVVRAVAAVTGLAPAASRDDGTTAVMEPLAGVVDPDALDGLFGPTTDGSGTISFDYHGQRVTVDATGRVTVTPGDASSAVVTRSPPVQELAERPGQ